MSKKSKVTPIPVSRPAQSVVRAGDEIKLKILSVDEYGKDDQGPFAIVSFGDPYPEGERMFVRSIDLGTESDEVDRITFTPAAENTKTTNELQGDAPPAQLGERIGREFETSSAQEEIGYGGPDTKIRTDAATIENLTERVANLDMKPVAPVMVNESIHVRLTEKERSDAAREAATLSGQIADAEEQFKNEAATHKARVKEVKAKIAALNDAHNTGLQYRTVTCEQMFDRERGITWLVYKGVTYRERAMTDHEMRSSEPSPLFGDMPDKVDPSALPHPSQLSGDELAKRASDMNKDGSGRDVAPEIGGQEAVRSQTNIGDPKPGKRKPPMQIDRVTMPESHGGVAAGNGIDPAIAEAMRDETKRGNKRDLTVS